MDSITTTAADINNDLNSSTTGAALSICEIENNYNNDPMRIHPRKMKNTGPGASSESFLCCDSIAIGEQSNFLDPLDCVPYRNNYYEAATIRNEIGSLDVVFCNVTSSGEEFLFAQPLVNSSNNTIILRYQCCRTDGPSTLPLFVQDSSFNISVYTCLTLFSIGVILSTILFLGLSIPLLQQSIRRHRNREGHRSLASSIISFSFRRNPDDADASSSRRRRQHPRSSVMGRSSVVGRQKPPTYSNYNLYLVYLALIDLIFASIGISTYLSYIQQTFDPFLYTNYFVSVWNNNDSSLRTPFDDPFEAPYIFANMWINAILSYEVLVLLKSSRQARKINQPSLKRINLQVGGVCLLAAVLGGIVCYAYKPAWEARNNGSFVEYENIDAKLRYPAYVLLLGLPLFYTIGVALVIWWKGYIPKKNGSGRGSTTTNARDKAIRELTFYFLRIVLVFLGIWIPRGFFLTYADESGKKWSYLIAECVVAIQPILSFGMMLTKSDVRKYLWNLVTLSYVGGGTCCGANNDMPSQIGDTTTRGPSSNVTGTGRSTAVSSVVADDVDGDGINEDAADSLVFSVLGFRLAEPPDVPNHADSNGRQHENPGRSSSNGGVDDDHGASNDVPKNTEAQECTMIQLDELK